VQIFLIETKLVKALELFWEGGGRELLLLLLLPLQLFLQSRAQESFFVRWNKE
jgi:hypothetical protein